MATLAPDRGTLVIRLVYDGPPESGKTTSLRVLAGSLSREIRSPEEVEGRTLLFDWVEYIGGSYEGIPIRCQIVSVPGQRVLARRRKALLADTTHRRIGETEECLRELRAFLDARPGPRPGVVLQANKRDQPDAEPLASLRARLDTGSIALIESIATEGTGIREAFVLSVRLALDRVRELVAQGTLEVRRPDAETAEDLISQIRYYEESAAPPARPPSAQPGEGGDPAVSLAALALREVLAREDAAAFPPPDRRALPRLRKPAQRPAPDPQRSPRLPDAAAPSGRVWPPVEGRVVLHAASSVAAEAHLRPDGSWQARAGSWHLHSSAEHEFDDLEWGREELVGWARLYAGRSTGLSPQRCIVLAETGGERWRLWQIVHVEESLRQRLSLVLTEADPETVAKVLYQSASRLLEARDTFAGDAVLPCRLSTIGSLPPGPVYIGLLPARSWIASEAELEPDDGFLMRREIEPLVRRSLSAAELDVPRVLDVLAGQRTASAMHRRTYEALASMLIA